jgi:hypothetical protein
MKFDNRQAFAEGWCLSDCYCNNNTYTWQIQRLDDPGAVTGNDGTIEPIFECDFAALEFVKEKAATSEYHALAFSMDMTPVNPA